MRRVTLSVGPLHRESHMEQYDIMIMTTAMMMVLRMMIERAS